METIAAISTAMSTAGIGIVRISGPDAVAVADRFFQTAKGEHDLRSHGANTIRFGLFFDAEGRRIDEILISVMKAPHSYTGEDVVEINGHGGMLVMKQILDAVLSDERCRIAEPGEFTKRAFLNGRIDLTRAEAVMDVISAESAFALENGQRILSGALREKVVTLRDAILHETAFIEAALDDPESYDLAGFPAKLQKTLCMLISECETLLGSAKEGQIRKEGIRTAIIGRPNAGKSSLFNKLLQSDRAIVTEIAGTTRDTLEESVRLGDILLKLIDTAGIRQTDDVIEQLGVDRSLAAAKEADLVLYVADRTEELDETDLKIVTEVIQSQKLILLLNKSDLKAENKLDAEALRQQFPGIFVVETMMTTEDFGSGMEDLKAAIAELFFSGALVASDELYLTNVRQEDAFRRAAESLKLVQESIDQGLSEDFYTIDLMNAYAALGEIIGEEVEDDLVDKIFSTFCMGK